MFKETAKHLSSQTFSGNGAIKFSSTGEEFVDQFGKLSEYRQKRDFHAIAIDCQKLWQEDPILATRFAFFVRMISRKTNHNGQKYAAKGAGLKHEGISRLYWLAQNHADWFYDYLPLYVNVASWKDIFDLLRYDLENGWWSGRKLDWAKIADFVIAGLEGNDLVKKYLPQIYASSRQDTPRKLQNTLIGKFLASRLKTSYANYRKLKASGTAHQWQQQISRSDFNIDFGTVHGRALAKLVSSKFLENHGLTVKYEAWVAKQPEVKFTGYPHELMAKVNYSSKNYELKTADKQFMKLVQESDVSKLIVVRDTSGSMNNNAIGTKVASGDIAKALALFFSYKLEGKFADSWIEFNRSAQLKTWVGATPTQKWLNDRSSYIGNTDFQSVIDLFRTIAGRGVPESEFPTGILCISDGEFDPADLNETNVETARKKLRQRFSEEYVANFKIILWNIPNGYYGRSKTKFETNDENVFYFSGYDGAILSFLTGKGEVPKTAKEVLLNALNQEILQEVIQQ